MNYVVYKHTHVETGKCYIGITNNLTKRNRSHKGSSSRCIAFKNAIQKYGWDAFQHEILYDDVSLDEAIMLEERCIIMYNSLSPTGYNLKSGGIYCKMSEETKERISKANKGKSKPPRSDKHKQNMSLSKQGTILSDEHKQKISQAMVGVTKSNEHKQNISKSRIGKVSNRKGQPCSEQHKQKLSQAALQRPIIICPHCGKSGPVQQMNRWHMNNCKHQISSENTPVKAPVFVK